VGGQLGLKTFLLCFSPERFSVCFPSSPLVYIRTNHLVTEMSLLARLAGLIDGVFGWGLGGYGIEGGRIGWVGW
jgi:hypothetical protein